MKAAQADQLEMVTLLLQYGARVNEVEKESDRTARWYAAKSVAIQEVLKKAGGILTPP